ncbi:MAG: hypothetical protein M3Y81_15370, partial [Chloroflexota bacterium]|nr:hypothetical protein [Chloroflexota bacterium]
SPVSAHALRADWRGKPRPTDSPCKRFFVLSSRLYGLPRCPVTTRTARQATHYGRPYGYHFAT